MRWSIRELAVDIQTLHDEACANGEPGYMDPDSGLLVMTANYLRERGYCCENGCRHCPYEDELAAAPTDSRASSE